MATNTTSLTVTFRLSNNDVNGSVEAIKALVALLNESLNNAPPEPILEVEL